MRVMEYYLLVIALWTTVSQVKKLLTLTEILMLSVPIIMLVFCVVDEKPTIALQLDLLDASGAPMTALSYCLFFL